MRTKQIERVLSGDESRDDVLAFLSAMVQDLRDVARAEIPSGVAARHLLKMRLATEMGEVGPQPLLEAEEPALPPPQPLERRRSRITAAGIAAAMVLMVGVAATITESPENAGTRAEGIVGSDVPRLSPEGPGRFDQFATNEARRAVASTAGRGRNSSAGGALTVDGASSGQPVVSVVGGAATAGASDGGGSAQISGDETRGGGGSGGDDSGSQEQSSSGGSSSGGNVTGPGTGGDGDLGSKAKARANGRGNGEEKSRADRAGGSEKGKGSGKKTEG
ncbi:MAG: hypothetical protein M3N24_01455 [Actinomycetota bacterium]|nr:hypothetical protein [Actinomycetota bacterium]